MARTELTLISKPGCHLCDDARGVLMSVVAELTQAPDAPPIDLVERSILDEPALYDEHVEDIPVVLINGRTHTFWRVDPGRLRSALTAAQAL